VRDSLRSLNLSNKSRLHIQSLMKQIFDAAMLWELVDVQANLHVTDATISAIANLDQSFFRVRFDRCTPREKD